MVLSFYLRISFLLLLLLRILLLLLLLFPSQILVVQNMSGDPALIQFTGGSVFSLEAIGSHSETTIAPHSTKEIKIAFKPKVSPYPILSYPILSYPIISDQIDMGSPPIQSIVIATKSARYIQIYMISEIYGMARQIAYFVGGSVLIILVQYILTIAF